MSIGTTIKRLRNEKDITQEQLAEYLGITSRAISQWECDKTSPDISLLPILANLFEVTADELLGIDINNKQKEIDAIYSNAMEISSKGYKDKSIAILESGLIQFPDSFKLMELYVTELYIRYVCNSSEPMELRISKAKLAIKYIDKIFEKCTDSIIRNNITPTACLVYSFIGRNEDALQIAKAAPEFYTRSRLLYMISNGTKKYESLRDNILSVFSNTVFEISELADCKYDNGKNVYSENEQLTLYQKTIDLFEIFFENKDYMYYAQNLEISHICMAKIYIARNDLDKSLYHIEKAAEYAIEFDNYSNNGTEYSSLLSKGIEKQDIWLSDTSNRSNDLLEKLKTDIFIKLHKNNRFIAIQSNLKKYAKS